MSTFRAVTPEEAQEWLKTVNPYVPTTDCIAFARTVATEPDRIRAAVVEALEAVRVRLLSDSSEHVSP
jgi:hypothetical protein